MSEQSWSPATVVVAAGRPAHTPGAGVNPPVELSSTYVAGGPVGYARVGNPTWSAFEEALGALEGGSALAYPSGMAAIAAVFALAPDGSRVVVPDCAYNTTLALADELDAAGRHEVVRVDIADADALAEALAHPTALLWLESPTNPLLDLCDLPLAVERGHAAGALIAVDNTFATPLGQQPLALGADVVVHSATKYLAGHSDVLLGATVAASPEVHERLHTHRTVHGAIPGPFETWLALRGLRTLHLRWERATASAAVIAQRLAGHPAVERVRYAGIGAIVSIEVRGGADAADAVCERTRLWTFATSLGGVESLLERRRRHPLEPTTVPENLVRLSVGIEDVEDLWRDLDAALRG